MGEEWIDPRLSEAIDNLEWPIAFVDFETILMTVPWYADTRPGQVLPFQFSAHILHRDGHIVHREWLNMKDEIPTLEFIRQLKSALKGVGSVLVYTDYENRILQEAFEFLRRYGKEASCPEVKEALAALLRNYVTLDTASQWIIFEHWQDRLNLI